MDHVPSVVLVVLLVSVWALAIGRLVKKRLEPVRSAAAEVIGKQKVEGFSKYAGNGRSERYAVIFSVGGKKKSFYVSQLSHDGYPLHETGSLTYQGNRLINFG